MRVLWLLAFTTVLAHAQVVWTPIYFEGNNQVDMWTAKAEGCRCSFDLSRETCACCVKEGGCQCGLQSPHRCGQCGLHQYCNNMCNLTLSSRNLFEKSGKRYGQIKSPSVEGPAFCWYRLLPDSGQRVEIQIYRLVSVGQFNNTSCVGGFVQLVSGLDSVPRSKDAQICGANERYAPPIVVYEDRGAATLIFQITEQTERSQFLAYFSFSPRNSTTLGFQPRGGRRIEHTECDWMYQDSWCRESGPCRLASPGFPGIYGPNKRCKYLITTSTPQTRVRIKFSSVSLPPNEHCSTHFVKVFHGSTTSSPELATLCGNKKQDVVHSGSNLLILFSSGPLVNPFHYNGFVANLEFLERPTSTTSPAPSRTSVRTTQTAIPVNSLGKLSRQEAPCELFYYSNQTRHGLFDSRGLLQHNQHNCTLVFIGGATDLVFISLANYNLRGAPCHSIVELYDGYTMDSPAPLIKRICSPKTKRTRDNNSRYQDRENYISKGNTLQLNFRRFFPTVSLEDTEYVQGAYLFHDELLQGTPTPSSLCDVEYLSATSRTQGHLTDPGETEIYWTIDGSLECTQRLVPGPNQSISINILTLRRLAADTHCHTECGDGGCKCVTRLLPLDHMDHLQILNDWGQPLCCICGPFEEDWLPVGVRSWSPLRLVYYVARYNWATKGFEYETDYRFHTDQACGHHVMTQHSGVIDSVNITGTSQMNYLFFQSCTWKLDSNVERQLTISVSSNQNRPCSAWNISIHEYYEPASEHAGKQFYTYCSRDKIKNYTLPFNVNIVIIRLRAMTNTPPHFRVKWRSQVVRANTRTSGYNPITSATTPPHNLIVTALLYLTVLSLTLTVS